MNDLSTLTTWVAILTVLVGVQLLVVIVLALRSMQLVKRVETSLQSAEQSLTPVLNEARALIDDLRSLRKTTQRIEHGVSSAYDKATAGLQFARAGVTRRFWPVFGALAAGRAVIRKISARRRSSRMTREDEIADARFVAEGGPIHDTR